jgi:hypothetical protein
VRSARRTTNLVLLGALVGAIGWQAASRGPEIVTYWQHVAQVGRAERSLDKGEQLRALELLGDAGRPGEARLGQWLVACHSTQEWPQCVAALQRSHPAARDAVARLLERSPEESMCAAEALAAVGDKRGVWALSGALISPTSGAHGPEELATLGEAGAMALVNVARFGPARARRQALLLLPDAQWPGRKRTLLGLIDDRRFPDKALVLRALGPATGPQVDDMVARLLSHADPAVRAEALRQYGARKGKAALPVLSRALDDPSVRVRLGAVEALSAVEGPAANALLVRALSDGAPRVVRGAVYSLGRRHAEEAASALAELYPHADRERKRDIALALCWMDSPLGPQYRVLWEQETGQQLPLSSAWDG